MTDDQIDAERVADALRIKLADDWYLNDNDEYEKRVHFFVELCTSSADSKTLKQYD